MNLINFVVIPAANSDCDSPETDGKVRLRKCSLPPSSPPNSKSSHNENAPSKPLLHRLEHFHALHREGRVLQAKRNLAEAQPMLEEVSFS
jgi:hypothetical protein